MSASGSSDGPAADADLPSPGDARAAPDALDALVVADDRVSGSPGALVVATAPGALTVVAGLPLVVRAVLELRSAGIATLAVFAGPQARRVAAMLADRAPGVPCLGSADQAAPIPWPERVLVVAGDLLFDAGALAPLLVGRAPEDPPAGPAGRVGRPPGVPGAGVAAASLPGASVPRLVPELSRSTGLRMDALRRLRGELTEVSLGPGLSVPLDSQHPASVLETALLDHLARRTSARDSYMAALVDRRLSRPVTRLLLRWPITPSQVTLAGIGLGLAGAVGLATVSYAGRLGGVLALVASIVLDCVDGEMARARYQQSAAGARLDVIGDYTVNLAVFVALGIGLVRQGLPAAGPWIAVALVAGVVASMAAMHVLFVRPALAGGGDIHWAGPGALRATPVTAVVEKLASRDYTYLLLVLALAGRLQWFLYAAAVGSWAFVAGLLGYFRYQRRPVPSTPAESL